MKILLPRPKVTLNLITSCKVSFVFESKPFKLVGLWCLDLNTSIRENTEKNKRLPIKLRSCHYGTGETREDDFDVSGRGTGE